MKKTNDTPQNPIQNIRYAGFYERMFASIIDTFLLFVATLPFFFMMDFKASPESVPMEVATSLQQYEQGLITVDQLMVHAGPFLQTQVLPKILTALLLNILIIAIAYLAFWKKSDSTPGKMLLNLKIVNADGVSTPTTRQYIIRFIGYIVATIPLLMGFYVMFFNKKKRGLHDYMAGTAVISTAGSNPQREQKISKYKTYFVLGSILFLAIYLATK